MKTGWASVSVEQCLVPVPVTGRSKIQTKDYKASGQFPIIDQGQDAIAGWTDDTTAVINAPLPLVVFGDHSRKFKFLKVPFARGADGTQLLRPVADFDPLYFYYALRSVDLPSRGYNRHFTILKEKELSYPTDVEEQRKIAAVLTCAERAADLQSKLVSGLRRTKAATMRELFSRGLRGEMQKNTKIGPIPASWELSPLGEHHSVVSGGTPSRSKPAFWNGGTIPWVKTTEVNYSVITATEEHITPEGLSGSAAKMLSAGTLLMAMYGQGVTRGKVGILGIDATCNQACAAISSKDDAVLPRYLYQFLNWRYEAIRSLAHGGQQQNLNLDIVRELPIVVPPDLSEQEEIIEVLDTIDKKIELHRRKRDVLDQLFRSLLHKLMAREISVDDLDLRALPAKGRAV